MLRLSIFRIFSCTSTWDTVVKFFYIFFISVICLEVYYLSKLKKEDDETIDFGQQPYEHPVIEDELISEITDKNPPSGKWQPVAGTRFKFYVYSAHFDDRQVPAVRILGATRPGADRVHCMVFHSEGSSEYVFVPASVKTLSGYTNLPFTAVTVTCPLGVTSPVPWAVAVVSVALPRAANLLRVDGPFPPLLGSNSPSIVACVQPIDHSYNQTTRLIEFIEMNTLLGVNHFMFYNQSVTSDVSCLLNDYVKQGRVTVMTWNFDFWSKNFEKVVQLEAMYAAFNDCLYRNINKFDYTTFVGLDEFLVPKKSKTLQEFLKATDERTAYSFSNAHFYLEWPDEKWDGQKVRTHYLATVYKTHRTRADLAESTHGHTTYLCRPETALKIGANYHLKLLPLYTMEKVEESEVLSQVYDSCGASTTNCTAVTSQVDQTMLRYADSLAHAMISQWKRATKTCYLRNDQGGTDIKMNTARLAKRLV